MRRWFSTIAISSRYALDPNSAGGLMAAFLPLQIGVLQAHRHEQMVRPVGALAVSITLLGLLMSACRGAWFALGVLLVSYGLWQLSRRLAGPKAAEHHRFAVWLLSMVVIGGCGLAFWLSPWGNGLRAFVEADRAVIWRNSLDLAMDYPFTGLGLGRFEMAYSSYSMLLHVGHTMYAHNLYLDVWLEQGSLGLIALGWLVGLALWPRPVSSVWRGAALASLAIILLHGWVEDIGLGSGGRVAVLAVPLAMLARPASASAPSLTPAGSGRATAYGAAAAGGVFAVLIIGIACVPRVRAAFLANLGAVAQSRIELSIYSWPEWSVQDELRRALEPDLLPARQFYQAALALDPTNAAANRRLGQIELSLGEYEAACDHLQQAYHSAPEQRATRQLMGECYALAGNLVDAAGLWRTIDISEGQITLRRFWYDSLGDHEWSDQLGQAVALVQSP
jgi:tetratricopeptide (TPR) repeat protein